MAAKKRLLIIGAGGFAREVAWLAECIAASGRPVFMAAFADDDVALHGTTLNGYPIFSLESARAEAFVDEFVVAVGKPRTREHLVARALALGLEPATLIHPRVERSRYVKVGVGAVICAGCTLTTEIDIQAYAQLNLHCTIGHDAVLEEYVTLAPGVHISGNVHVGRRSYLGTGAVLLNGIAGAPIVIGQDAVIGAGACVTKSIPDGVTAVGVPARPLAGSR